MGWPRKNEIARVYRERRKGGEYILAMENDKGNFMGAVMLVRRLDQSKWGVTRKPDGKVCVQYDGVTQQVMGDWTTLCLDGGTLKPSEATDEQVLRAYLGDENIYTGVARYPNPEDQDAYFMVEGYTPDTWSGSYKRISLDECPEEFQNIVANALRGYFRVGVEEARGLYRTGNKSVRCKLCGNFTDETSAHLHQGRRVCDGCWDERLRTTA